jgi:hypothetical protein
MVGAAGSAIQFVLLLVVVGILGLATVLQAGYVFVTIAQQTADGRDEVDWPKEFWFDRVGKGLHLAGLVAFWLVPLGFLLRFIGPLPETASAALYVGVPAGLFWLLFPITLLSSFSASSPWVVFRWEPVGRMARRPGTTFGFYIATLPLCLAGGTALYVTLAWSLFYVLPALATVLFLYARLMGRTARLLGEVNLRGAKRKVDREVRRAARAAQIEDPWESAEEEKKKERPKKKKKKPAARAHDPWAVPEDEATAPEPGAAAVEGYGLARDDPPPARSEPRKPPRVKGYKVSAEEPPPRPKEEPLDGSPPIEARRIPSERELPLPQRPLVDGVWTFPWYYSNLGMWGLITLLFLAWGYLYATMQAVRPF